MKNNFLAVDPLFLCVLDHEAACESVGGARELGQMGHKAICESISGARAFGQMGHKAICKSLVESLQEGFRSDTVGRSRSGGRLPVRSRPEHVARRVGSGFSSSESRAWKVRETGASEKKEERCRSVSTNHDSSVFIRLEIQTLSIIPIVGHKP